jgi:hypothetical protein
MAGTTQMLQQSGCVWVLLLPDHDPGCKQIVADVGICESYAASVQGMLKIVCRQLVTFA